MNRLLLWLAAVAISTTAQGKKPKVQTVDFSEVDINGKIRNPDGSFLVQKKGIEFLPLFEISEKFHGKILQTHKFIRQKHD